MGVVESHRQAGFPGAIDFRLTAAGRELLEVAELLRRWLLASPEGPVELGTSAAKGLVKALVDGWSSTMIRAIAARPLSLNELNSLITGLNYPSVERRLRAMRLAGLVEAIPGSPQGTPYGPSDWLRVSIAPLAAAARWERAHIPGEAAPIGVLDVEAAFLLVVPALEFPDDASGDCRLAVELGSNGGDARLAGVLVQVRDGEVVSCVSRLRGSASAWAAGSASAWLRAVIEHDLAQLEVGGDTRFARALVEAVHGQLYRSGAALSSGA
jgi:DNA-binding HxlR family transcriptional regulator